MKPPPKDYDPENKADVAQQQAYMVGGVVLCCSVWCDVVLLNGCCVVEWLLCCVVFCREVKCDVWCVLCCVVVCVFCMLCVVLSVVCCDVM